MGENTRIVLGGATGLIGKKVYTALLQKKYSITVLARNIDTAKKHFPEATCIHWNDINLIDEAIDGAYGVINTSGAPLIGQRWSASYKKVLLDSRISPTQIIVNAIHKAKHPPEFYINASAVGIYGSQNSQTIYEEKAAPATDFLAQVCTAWEDEAFKAKSKHTRVVTIRSAIVLDKYEGALPRMLTPFKYGLGGTIGSGTQWFPWIHIEDEVGIILYALEHPSLEGPVNAVAPDMISNATFTKTLGKVLHRPTIFPIPIFLLYLIFGEAATVLTTGVRVSPEKVLDAGYVFKYATIHKALSSLLA